MATDDLHQVPTARAALIALGAVAIIALAMIAASVFVTMQTAERTRAIASNSLRSLELIAELRQQTLRLEEAPLDRRQELERQVARDLREYAPLATGPGEAAEWERLDALIERILTSPPGGAGRELLLEQLETSSQRLAEINLISAHSTIAHIGSIQRTRLVVQIVGGVFTLLAAVLVASILMRVMRRQRLLSQRYLDSLRDRNQELAAFAHRTAHDLRGPLSPIQGYADLLAEGEVEGPRAAARIRAAVESMSNIIDNLLALSVSGHPPAGEAAVAPLIRDLLDELRGELGDAEVVTELEDRAVACPPSVLGQLLRNLIGNAGKYRSPRRRLRVEVCARRRDAQVEIMVADNGIGMSSEEVARAFELNYRAEAAREIAGFGIGLSIVKRTVESLGGSCQLTSELDRGTRVVMRLPDAARAATTGAGAASATG